jgi:hypothetical protein
MRTTLRRGPLTATAGLATLTLLAPGAALAHGRHHRHHQRGHHAHVSFIHLGPTTASATGTGTAGATTPATTPSTGAGSTTTSTTTNENAGTVASYTGGVLTLTLTGGSHVSGKVTADTQFECVSATPTTPPSGDQDDEGAPGDDNGLGDDQSEGDSNQGGDSQVGQQLAVAGQWQDGGDHSQGDDQDDEAPIVSEPPCDSSALIEGAVVRAAELRIAPGGTEFESIVLVR